MKTDRLGFSLVSLAVVAGLVLALINPSPASHAHVAAAHTTVATNN